MKKMITKGLDPMRNGHGPWVGAAKVVGFGECELLAGLATDPGVRAYGRCLVAIIHPDRNWSWTTDDPVVCETVANMVEAMGEISPEQLENIGFISQGWERVNKG